MEPRPYVENVSKEYECPICLILMYNPMLTSCCGQHFCDGCIRKVLNDQSPCPLCKKKAFEVFLNKHFDRNLRNLKAKCSLKDSGCSWEGTVSNFSDHYSQCGYVVVACPNACSSTVVRKLLDHHLNNTCPLRKSTCQYCGLEGTHQFLTNQHPGECPDFPVQCPNLCNVTVRRTQLSQHLTKCLLQTVPCSFRFFGCAAELRRLDTEDHERLETPKHLTLVCAEMHALRVNAQAAQLASARQIEDLERRAAQAEAAVKDLRSKLQGLEVYISTVLTGNLPALFTTTMTNFTKFRANNDSWYSQPFYTGPSGYKVRLKVHTATESDMAIHVYVLRGEFDDTLTWPLNGEVIVELVSALNDRHHRKTRKGTWWQVIDVDSRATGVGWGNFIPYRALTSKEAGYVQTDCITIRVVAFNIMT